jgi:Xaa-Pro aminopeptidase
VSVPPAGRTDRLAKAVAAEGLDAMVVGDLVRPGDSHRDAMADLIWLTGYTGTSALALIGPGDRMLATDFRYFERVVDSLPDGYEAVRAERELVEAIGSRMKGRVGFDEAKTSVKSHAALAEAAPGGVELVAVSGVTERLRRVKDEAEIAAMAEAAKLTDAVYAEIEERGLLGRSEIEVAVGAEVRMRELGATGPSFPPIVAAGLNGAQPHAEPGEHEIAPGEPVVIDMGAIVDGYCSDCTRTYAASEPSPEAREVYELVREAQQAALDGIRAGVSGKQADAIAREIIEAAGHGEHFGHGLGHGVGVEIHEAPRLAKRSDDHLEANEAVTVEPGVYVPGEFGVRIEDLVIVEPHGHRNLSSRPRELLVLG